MIIPNYNRASLVGDTIRNMLAQTLAPHEIIVVDDGSTDNSVDVIAAFGARVQLIQQTNQGPGAARNAGLKVATGDYIQFMDSDDLASINKFECQVDALKRSGADFAYSPWIHCRINEQGIQFTDDVLQALPVPADKPMLEWFISGWSLVFQNCLFKRSILDKAGFYRTDLMPSEDSELFIRILLQDAKPVHTPDCIVFYRDHDFQKITDSGTSKMHKINDWTKFLNITGTLLKDIIPTMTGSTRFVLAAMINAHYLQVLHHGGSWLDQNHPYYRLHKKYPTLTYKFFSYYQSLQRKLNATPDFHPAFKRTRPADKHALLVAGIGFNLIQLRK